MQVMLGGRDHLATNKHVECTLHARSSDAKRLETKVRFCCYDTDRKCEGRKSYSESNNYTEILPRTSTTLSIKPCCIRAATETLL
jgi:hypothetical protein